MKLATALLCDFASARGSVLTIVGGGVNQVLRPSYPGPLGVMIAIALEVEDPDYGRRHMIKVAVRSEDGQVVGDVTGGFDLGRVEDIVIPPRLKAIVPMAIPLGLIILPSPGVYDVVVYLNGRKAKAVSVLAQQGPAAESPGVPGESH